MKEEVVKIVRYTGCVLCRADAVTTTSVTERRKSWQSYARLKQTPVSSSAASFRPRTLTTSQPTTTALLAPTSKPPRNGGTSPAAAVDDTLTHPTLSPIVSGSSSISYAPKSSASTCGGTTAGAGGVGISPDESAADAAVSHAFLLDVDQRLQHINSYVYLVPLSLFCLSYMSVCLSVCLSVVGGVLTVSCQVLPATGCRTLTAVSLIRSGL